MSTDIFTDQCRHCLLGNEFLFPGYYCEVVGLPSVTGPCTEGYFCTLGAEVSSPTDGVTGNICPVGSYCPIGTAVPQLCSPGNFTNAEGNTQVSDCQECTAGQLNDLI